MGAACRCRYSVQAHNSVARTRTLLAHFVCDSCVQVSQGAFEWPERRCDTIRFASAVWAQLAGFCNTCKGWVVDSKRAMVLELQRITRYSTCDL